MRSSSAAMPRPTRAQLADAVHRTVPDLIAPDLSVLFCGINPGLYSAATGHHFARPGNRFWPVLHGAGFTKRLLVPSEEKQLLAHGYGITNLVARTTATAAELDAAEFRRGRNALLRKIRRYRPGRLAILGIGAYRSAFNQPRAMIGPQSEAFGGARVWVLPNPSGLNANHQLGDLVAVFGDLYDAVHAE